MILSLLENEQQFFTLIWQRGFFIISPHPLRPFLLLHLCFYHFRFVKFNGCPRKRRSQRSGKNRKGGQGKQMTYSCEVLSVRCPEFGGNFNKTFDAGGELTFSIKCRQLPKNKKMETAAEMPAAHLGRYGGNFYIPESFAA